MQEVGMGGPGVLTELLSAVGSLAPSWILNYFLQVDANKYDQVPFGI